MPINLNLSEHALRFESAHEDFVGWVASILFGERVTAQRQIRRFEPTGPSVRFALQCETSAIGFAVHSVDRLSIQGWQLRLLQVLGAEGWKARFQGVTVLRLSSLRKPQSGCFYGLSREGGNNSAGYAICSLDPDLKALLVQPAPVPLLAGLEVLLPLPDSRGLASTLEWPALDLVWRIRTRDCLFSLAPVRLDVGLCFRLEDRMSLEYSAYAKVSLGTLEVPIDSVIHLRPGVVIEFERPERFKASIDLGGLEWAWGELRIEDRTVKLEIEEVIGPKRQAEETQARRKR